MTPIDLMLDNDNELRFKVNIEGTRPGTSVCRLILENNDIQYGFKGIQAEDGEISVVVPPLKRFINEGVYDSHLEVVVDDRIFIPLEMKINFEKSVAVTAESVVRPRRTKVSASAVLLEAPPVAKNNAKTLSQIQNNKRKVKEDTMNDRKILELLKVIKQQKRK